MDEYIEAAWRLPESAAKFADFSRKTGTSSLGNGNVLHFGRVLGGDGVGRGGRWNALDTYLNKGITYTYQVPFTLT